MKGRIGVKLIGFVALIQSALGFAFNAVTLGALKSDVFGEVFQKRLDSEGLDGLRDIVGMFGEHFGYLFGTFGGIGETFLGTFGGSGTYFEAGSSRKGAGNFGVVFFGGGAEKWPQGLPKTPGKAPKLRSRVCQEATERVFERKTLRPQK